MSRKLAVIVGLFAAVSLSLSAQTVNPNKSSEKLPTKILVYSDNRVPVESVDIAQAHSLLKGQKVSRSVITPNAKPIPLQYFQVWRVCSLATSASTSWTCESIAAGQTITALDYNASTYRTLVILEMLGYGTTPTVQLGGKGGMNLPSSALVSTTDICSNGSTLDTNCPAGELLVGEFYQYDISTYVRQGVGVNFYAFSLDVNTSDMMSTDLFINN